MHCDISSAIIFASDSVWSKLTWGQWEIKNLKELILKTYALQIWVVFSILVRFEVPTAVVWRLRASWVWDPCIILWFIEWRRIMGWAGNDVEGNGFRPFEVTIPVPDWRDWGEQRIILVRIVGVPSCSLVVKYQRFGRICVPRHDSRKATLVMSALVTDLHVRHCKPIWKYIFNLLKPNFFWIVLK
jgi:hypothetical protein